MAAFRLTVLAALACFSLLPVSRFAAAQEPSFSPIVSSAQTTATSAVMSTTVPPIVTTTIAPTPTPTVTSPTVTSSPPSPTSTTPTVTSSSPSPTTTTTTTSTPTPTPPAHSYYILNATTHRVCVLVIANVQLTLSYTNTSSNKSVSKDLAVTGNLNATVDHTNSHCNENSSTVLVLTFQADPDYNHSLTFQFNETKDGYELTSVLTYLNFDDSTLFPGYNTSFTDSVTGNTSSIFSVGQGKSYKCDSSKTYGMKQVPQDAVKNLNVKISGLQAQAFDFNNMKDQFDKSISCTKDQKTSKIVPIAVGAALAGLVVVVLIAYLIGRFRSRKQNSYEALS